MTPVIAHAILGLVSTSLNKTAPSPARGSFEPGYEALARCFADHLASEQEIGAGLTVYRRGRRVVDLWGGMADRERARPWERDSRVVLFSVSKGFTAMGLHLLADRGRLDWNAPVSTYWPGFAQNGKEGITVATLLNHRGGLPYLDTPLSMADCVDDRRRDIVVRALETQRPAWKPGEGQAYHAITFGLYARELFERAAGEPLGAFLRRELFEPLRSDVWLGTPASEDDKIACLYPPPTPSRVGRMLSAAFLEPDSPEARVAREILQKDSLPRRAFLNPALGDRDLRAYNDVPIRRATLAWASATGSADGVARAYLPFAAGGVHEDRRYLRASTLEPAYRRLGWSDRDGVLMKPLGWSHGFLKEERHLFSPNPESFGHAGMGGALGWCDPKEGIAFGYVMNRMDWRVRSTRAIALCRALYESEALLESRAS